MQTQSCPERQWIGLEPPDGYLTARASADDPHHVAFLVISNSDHEARLARHFRSLGWGVCTDREDFLFHSFRGSGSVFLSDDPSYGALVDAGMEVSAQFILIEVPGTNIIGRIDAWSLQDHKFSRAIWPLMTSFASFALVHDDSISGWPGFFPVLD